jgi:hypothetical protein
MKITAILLALTPTVAFSSVSLLFSDINNSLTGLSNSSGPSPVNGLAWGVLVDTLDDEFNSPLFASVGLKIEDGADFGNGYTFFYGGVTVQQTFSFDTGNGAVITSESFTYSSGAAPGQNFAIMWFDSGLNENSSLSAGDNYGLLTNAGYNLPPDNSNNFSYAALAAGADPTRLANLELIPEPSTALLAFFGLAGLLRRKR